MYKFFLTYNGVKTEIGKEPIGWDSFETVLKRSASHGISTEYSELDLKFYDRISIDILRHAYETDIDSVVTFSVENDQLEEYSGQVDFGEYKDCFEKYCYIQVKVSEIGIQATFNNRLEQKVDIDSLVAFDGSVLPEYSNLNKTIQLPGKEIQLISSSRNLVDVTTEGLVPFKYYSDIRRHFRIDFAFAELQYSELNDYFGAAVPIIFDGGNGSAYNGEVSPIFVLGTMDEGLSVAEFSAMFYVKCKISIPSLPFETITGKLMVQKGDDRTILYQIDPASSSNNEVVFDAPGFALQFQSLDKIYLCAELLYIHPSNNVYFDEDVPVIVKVEAGSYFEIKALSKFEDTQARLSMVHEVMSRITESITDGQLSVKSDLYGRKDSEVNEIDNDGPASYKALSTGLRIRGAYMSDGSVPQLSLSFSDLMKGLTPIDNIGYGIVKENDNLLVRVEPWSWFYQNEVVFAIDHPASIIRSLNPSDIITRFKIGYKKYETGDYNSIDAFMSEREYRTRIKLVETSIEQLSDLIADGYAIEYTRRLSLKKDTKDWQYDNDYFIFVLKHVIQYLRRYQDDVLLEEFVTAEGYQLDTGVTDSGSTVISPSTVYNARISPARIVRNWRDKIFAFKRGTPEQLTFTSGAGNITASFKPEKTASKVLFANGSPIVEIRSEDYLYHRYDDEVIAENSNHQSSNIILKPEVITVNEYPVMLDQYHAIRNNPYGTITVDEEPCFLKEMKYKRKSGTATFTLIPKYQ